MILKDENADREFKTQFASCVTHDELRVNEFLILLRAQKDFDVLGQAFVLTAQNEIEEAKVEVRRGYLAATDSDEASLFALADILKLLPSATDGFVKFADLAPELLHYRVSLFYHLNDLTPGKFTLPVLTALEVEANCLYDQGWMGIGEHGPNRISDLLHGSEMDQALALDLLDRAHAANFSGYDMCYSDLILAKAQCKDKKLRKQIASAAAYIEKHNPREVLPDTLATVLALIRSGQSPADVLHSEKVALGLKNDDVGALALATADVLCESGEQESAIHVLSAAAKYLGSDLKTAAWAGFLLGDKVHTARVMFAYGLQSGGNPFFDRIERFHAVELACRLMYETHTAAARQELQTQSDAYDTAGFHSNASRIRQWLET